MGCNIPRPLKRPPTPQTQPKQIRFTNCPNCCAPITGTICEYCGTRFGGMDLAAEDDQIVIPIYIGQKQVDEAIKSASRSAFMAWNPAADVKAPPLPVIKQR